MPDYYQLRNQFDEVLKRHIRRLMDTFPNAHSLPFDLTTVTSLILLVERENEIEAFPDSASTRYNESTLLDDLVETGLEVDDRDREAVKNLEHMGFVSVDDQDRFIPRESAARLVGVLDNLFPGYPGLGLVAYVLQTIDETMTGRKDLDHSLRQFDQTLNNCGVPMSSPGQSTELKNQEHRKKEQTGITTQTRTAAYLQSLSKIRSQTKARPSETSVINTISNIHPENTKVRSLFSEPPATDSDMDIPAQEPEVESADATKSNIDCHGEAALEAQGVPVASEASDLKTQDEQTEIAENEKDEINEIEESSVIETDTEVEETEEIPTTGDAPAIPEVVPHATRASEESPIKSIEEQIEAFEEDLAMSCPACNAGKVDPAVTEKGKSYYVCSNENCNFISWGKPYHFSCAYCQNPFLIEFTTASGINGLKCPKATCNYRQEYLGNPNAQHHSPQAVAVNADSAVSVSNDPPRKKKKRVVKKKVVRRKR